ncbi:VF530 family DNA-binding protein [Rouxiella sp. WC2420]|uniref:VF530 family DNA-binding protein n=1 Tax=Rouxiella sp. WC2420 TaxID=3234145 RepID=A0AB39VNQ9_9GAMM
MTDIKPKDPLHGVTLEKLLTELVENFGWLALAGQVNINCFKSDPSIKSSLKFLRRTPWARKEVETLYLDFVEGLLKPDMSPMSKRRTAPASAGKPAAGKKVSSAKPAADSPWNNHPLLKKDDADKA